MFKSFIYHANYKGVYMSNLLVERIKDKFGKDKEALQLYEQETGRNVISLYNGTVEGDLVIKGTFFEYYVFKQLYKIKGYKRFLFNVYLPTNTGTTEIDVLLLHEKGIFVFECKYYSGKIYGKEHYKMWTQYVRGKKSSFYNPIKQNQGHIDALKKLLSEKEKELVLSFVAFSGVSELKVDYQPRCLIVGNTDECIFEIKKVLPKIPVKFTEQEINEIYERLYPYSHVEDVVKQKHIDDIKSHQSLELYIINNIKCSRCGKSMKLMKGKKYYLKCSECENTDILSVNFVNEYITSHKVKCPIDKGNLVAKLGQYGLYIKCEEGHYVKLEEI